MKFKISFIFFLLNKNMVCSSQRCSTAGRSNALFPAGFGFHPLSVRALTASHIGCHLVGTASVIPPFVPCSLGSLFFALGCLQVAHPSRIPTPEKNKSPIPQKRKKCFGEHFSHQKEPCSRYCKVLFDVLGSRLGIVVNLKKVEPFLRSFHPSTVITTFI